MLVLIGIWEMGIFKWIGKNILEGNLRFQLKIEMLNLFLGIYYNGILGL